MEKVELRPEIEWNWKCPSCKCSNGAYEDDLEEVECDYCTAKFEPDYV